MSSAQNSPNDVYISYSSPDEKDGWVELLHKRLSTLLAETLGHQPRIWRNAPKMQDSEVFQETIREAIQRSLLFVPIITPSYLKSEWCRQEMRAFHVSKVGETDKSYRSRAFKVLKTPVPLTMFARQPAYLRDLRGYQFYEHAERGLFIPFSPEGTDKRYWSVLNRLAHDMAQKLNELKNSPQELPDGSETPPDAPVSAQPRSEVPSEKNARLFVARSIDGKKLPGYDRTDLNKAPVTAPKGSNPSAKPHEVFISYSNKDIELVREVRTALEEAGIECWTADDDILPSEIYGKAIIKAINSSRLVLLIFTANSNSSRHVETEIDRAYNKQKPIILLRIENVDLSESFEYYLSTGSWLNASEPPLNKHLPKLIGNIQKLLD